MVLTNTETQRYRTKFILQMHKVLMLLHIERKEIVKMARDVASFQNLIDCIIAAGALCDFGLPFIELHKISMHGANLNNFKLQAQQIYHLKDSLSFTDKMIKDIISTKNGGLNNLVTLCRLAKPMIAALLPQK